MRFDLKNHWLPSFVVTGWLAACLCGLILLQRYEATAGTAGTVPSARPEHRSSLIMFAHPRCPCTRASLNELAVVIASRPRFESVRVVFTVPDDAPCEWLQTDLVRQAKGMTGVEVVIDAGGRLSSQSGAETSGYTLLYDEGGHLKFSGGITRLRGHEGPNTGRIAVIALGQKITEPRQQTPVFGCPLVDTTTDMRNAICRSPQ